MSDYQVTLSIPAGMYDRARQQAEQSARPIEDVLVSYLESVLTGEKSLPPDEQEELDALAHLSDDALWTIAREQLPAKSQARMSKLLEGNSLGKLSSEERFELEELVERGDRVTLRKAEAAALLTERGFKVTPKDLAAKDD